MGQYPDQVRHVRASRPFGLASRGDSPIGTRPWVPTQSSRNRVGKSARRAQRQES